MRISWTPVNLSKGILFITLLSGSAARAESITDKLSPRIRGLLQAAEFEGNDQAMEQARKFGIPLGKVATDHVAVIVETTLGSSDAVDLSPLEARGARVSRSRSYLRVELPPREIRSLAQAPAVRLVRTPFQFVELGGKGDTVSQSVARVGALTSQDAGFVGHGVKVAVVDAGFAGLSLAIEAGELPASTQHVRGGRVEAPRVNDSDHGVAVAEHLVDMAPGVELHCITIEDLLDLENAIEYIRFNNIPIANLSLGWPATSYRDNTGPVTSLINVSRHRDGVLWTVAAGNSARSHWRGRWRGQNTLAFSGAAARNGIATGRVPLSVFLTWNQFDNPQTDLDLELQVIDERGPRTLARSEFCQGAPTPSDSRACDSHQAPVEWLDIENPDAAPIFAVVRHRRGPLPNDLDLSLVVFGGELQFPVATSSIMEPADAAGAYSVGAADHLEWGRPAPRIEPFSSRGPSFDGRTKPDIVAPDGTDSWTYFPNSALGTSFAAPTVAGAAALLLQMDPKLAPTEAAEALTAMARAVPAGDRNTYGAGLLNFEDQDTDGKVDPLDACPTAIPCDPSELDSNGDTSGEMKRRGRSGCRSTGRTLMPVFLVGLFLLSLRRRCQHTPEESNHRKQKDSA